MILENVPLGGKCDGFNGLGRVYRCSADVAAKYPPSNSTASASK